jgi:hypothetical protein
MIGGFKTTKRAKTQALRTKAKITVVIAARLCKNHPHPSKPGDARMKIALPLIVSLGMFTTMTALSLGLWSTLPAGTSLPVLFGLADRAVPAAFALSVMPAAVLIAAAMFSLGAKSGKRINAYPERYIILWLAFTLILAVGHGLIIRGALTSL